jgi:hypothetical protein
MKINKQIKKKVEKKEKKDKMRKQTITEERREEE